MSVPPGIIYLAFRLPRILFPPIVTYALVLLCQSQFGIELPQWSVSTLLFLSPVLAFVAGLAYSDYVLRGEAAAVGAILPPVIVDPTPGGIRTLWREIQSSQDGYIGDGVDDMVNKVGGYTFNFKVLFENRMATADPEYIKAVLATQFDDFEKGPEFRGIFKFLLGTGVFAADGELWKFHRSMTRPFFTRDRISDFDNFDKHAEDAIRQLRERLREGYPVDLQDLTARFTLDSATEFLFGNDVRSLAAGIPYPYYSPLSQSTFKDDPATRFAKAFSEAQLITVNRARLGVHWPLLEFFSDKIRKPMKIVHGLIDPIVAEAIAKKRRSDDSKGSADTTNDNETLLQHLVNSTEDPIILRDEIMNLLVAGRDTTSSTLTFVIYMLAQHPEVLKQLRQEILDNVGPRRRPNFDDFRNMKYVRAVINETLRLYPPVPFNVRTSKAATTWPSRTPGGKPFYIPANTRIPYVVYFMHRRKDLWGPDALEFDPNRFIDERLHKYLTPNPFIFLPFNAGPRICLGQQFAYNEVSFFLVRLLQNFSSISLATEAQPPASRAPLSWAAEGGRKAKEQLRPKAHLTMHIQDGLWVTMEDSRSED